MRSRFFTLAAYFNSPKVLACSDLILYRSAIDHAYIYSKLLKYANSDKLMAVLTKLETPPDVKEFVLALPSKFQGFAIGQINKNKAISKIELENFIQQVQAKEELKEKTKSNIEEQLPAEVPASIRPWMVIQIKKYPDLKDALIFKATSIEHFVKSHDQELTSYTAPDMLDTLKEQGYVHETETADSSPISQFFHKVKEQEYGVVANYPKLLSWAMRHFLRIRKEWRNNIEKTMKKEGKTFEQLLGEGKALFEAQQRGDLRGQEMPHSPLHNGEHASLLTNLENIRDWYLGETRDNPDTFDIKSVSVSDAIRLSKEWHDEQAKKGTGKNYDPINAGNIVYGPNNWKNKEYTGYFILELKSDNDLKTEGFKMNHCVGGYCEFVKSGRSRIFSLRNTSAPGTPIITIETDGAAALIRQDYGPGNRKIEQIYHDMINEWNTANQGNLDVTKLQYYEIQTLMNNNRISKENILKLVDHKDPVVRKLLASNESITPEIANILLKDESSGVRYKLAENPSLPIDALIVLTTDSDIQVRESVASNPKLPEESIIAMSSDKSPKVRLTIASRENLPIEVIQKLVDDPESEVVTAIILNPTVPAEIKEPIDPSRLSLHYISVLHENGKLTPDMVRKLAKSDNVAMRKYIAGTSDYNGNLVPLPPDVINDFIHDESDDVRIHFILHRELSPDNIKQFSVDPSDEVISVLLKSQEIDEDTIRNIAEKRVLNSSSTKVGRLELALARNDNTPGDVLRSLYNIIFKSDRGEWGNYSRDLKEALLENGKMPQELLTETFQNGVGSYLSLASNPNTPQYILQKIFEKRDGGYGANDVAMRLVKNPNTPAAILRDLYETHGDRISEQLIANHNTPSSVLKKIYNKSKHYSFNGADYDEFRHNPNTPAQLLESLYQKGKKPGNYENLEVFAKNKGTPSKILQDVFETLVDDAELFGPEEINNVLILLSKNPGTPADIINNMYLGNVGIATVGDKALRLEILPHIALNIATPVSILRELSKTSDPAISRHAKETLIRASQLRKTQTKPQYMKRRVDTDVDQIPEEDIDSYWPWGGGTAEREPTYDDNDPELKRDREPDSGFNWEHD